MLRSDPVGVVLRADDPLASREAVQLSDLADRRWFQFPPGTDRVWSAYWTGKAPDGASQDGPVVRTTRECIHAVMWNDSIGLAPLTPQGHDLPEEVTTVRLSDMPPSRLVIAWNRGDANPLIRSLIQIAAAAFRAR